MPPQNTNKPLAFDAGPGDVFVVYLISGLMYLIPFVGFAMSFNYSAKWMAEHTTLNGRKLTYSAKLGETWVLLFVSVLLLMITFGIYILWFMPKLYRFVYDHVDYADQAAMGPSPMPVDSGMPSSPAPAPVTDVTPPSAPTPPAGLVQ